MGKKMELVYQELAEYFVFDPQKYTLDEFFTDVKTFKDSFLVANIFQSHNLFILYYSQLFIYLFICTWLLG